MNVVLSRLKLPDDHRLDVVETNVAVFDERIIR